MSAASTSNNGIETESSNGVETNETTDGDIVHWHDRRGYAYASDYDDVVPVHRLTAYAEYGDELFDGEKHVHHELAKFIHAPRWLDAVTPEEHGEIHGTGDSRDDVDGFPVRRSSDVEEREYSGGEEHDRTVVANPHVDVSA